ncbi:MAG: phosphatase PAP2 family protein [Acidobacteria bacterium]|nr:phosphatase PAP2 family protein [Acidobacteriota bacterium]MBV9477657.1 phosphatase PAP2 family protein [Acidobacteriota bacterium]
MHFVEADDVLQSRLERFQGAAERLFEQLDRAEVEVVLRVSAAARALRVTWLACAVTRLGNGALYPVLALLLIATRRVESPERFLVVTSANLVVTFTIYPLLKYALARTRPCDYEPELARHAKPLDHYSCPSGHTMTAVAFGVTVMFAWPDGASLAIPLCVVMGWSRVALGHHYPTDVLAGGAIGAAVAAPLAAFAY